LPNKIPIDLTFSLQQSRAIAQLNIILTQTDPMLVAESFQVRIMKQKKLKWNTLGKVHQKVAH
jgi:hypothetical protein